MTFMQAAPPSFWHAPSGSSELFLKIALTLLVGFGLMVLCFFLPSKARRPIIAVATFIAGAYWVLYYFWPTPGDRGPNDIPSHLGESISFYLSDANPIMGLGLANTLATFIIGLGIYSLVRIHLTRLTKQQKDWQFSVLLLAALVLMVIFGYWDFKMKLDDPNVAQNWTFVQTTRDFLFEGLFQVMESAMFSIIAFFILSAAYRAFRIRSIEATILLAAALIMMLNLMGGLVYLWDSVVSSTLGDGGVNDSFKLSVIAKWIADNLQAPGIRAIEFGIGIGALAMGLRLWLSLERGGVNR